MRRALLHALRLTLANFTTVFWIYLRISLIAWAFSAAAFWGWIRLVQPEWIGVSFFFRSGYAPSLARHATLAALQRHGVVPKASAGTATSLGKLVCPTSSHRLTSRLRACGPDSHWKTDRRDDRHRGPFAVEIGCFTAKDSAVLLPNHSRIEALLA
jgi:hypothetical protein